MSTLFESGYEEFVRSIGGQKVFQSSDYVHSVESAINKLQNDINRYNGDNNGVGQLKGFVAEFWHCDTHNIDAAVKDVKSKTEVLQLNTLGSTDISSNFGIEYQSKYYKDGHLSAKEQTITFYEKYKSTNFNGTFEEYLEYNNIKNINKNDPLYIGQERLIPTEQLNDAIIWLNRKIATESAIRPELVERYKNTLEHLTDRVRSNSGSESIPLTDSEAKDIAMLAKQGAFASKKWHLTTEELIKFENIMQQSLKAGLSAATISMVLKIAPELYKILEKAIKNENITSDDIRNIGLAALTGGTEGFIRGAISAGLTTACLSGQLGVKLKSVNPTIIGAVTVITLNVIQNSIKLARNKINKIEFANACMRDLFVTTYSLVSGGITQGLIHIPVLGYMLGSFIGSIAASFVYDTGYKAFISFCCDNGFAFFGLVDQNYSLPNSLLKEIGIDIFEYEKISIDKFEIDHFEIEKFEVGKFEIDTIEICFLRRGVIGINKIGYV
jgi:hypothetical protein